MIKKAVIVFTSLLIISGCATVSEKTQQIESPVPKTEYITAQKQAIIPAQKRYKQKIAIARFTNETNYGRALLNDQDLDRIGKQASDMLASRLIKSEKFLVFERPDIQKLKREQELTGDMKLIGVNTLIAGSVTEFGRSIAGKSGFLSKTKMQVARAKVDIRLIDVRTGHAFFSAIGSGEANTESGEVAGFGSYSDYDATLNDRAIAAAISDVIDKLVSTMEDRPWRTDILDIQGKQIFISGGERQGLKVGDILQVVEYGKTVNSKQSGFDISLPPKQIATIRLISFFGTTETDEGSLCELVSGSIDKELINKIYVTEVNKQ